MDSYAIFYEIGPLRQPRGKKMPLCGTMGMAMGMVVAVVVMPVIMGMDGRRDEHGG